MDTLSFTPLHTLCYVQTHNKLTAAAFDFCEDYANKFEATQHEEGDGGAMDGGADVDIGQDRMEQLDDPVPNFDDEPIQEAGEDSFNSSGATNSVQATKSPQPAKTDPTQASRRSVAVSATAPMPKRKKTSLSDANTICTIDIVTGGMHASHDLVMHRIQWEHYEDPEWWQSQLKDYEFSDQYVGQVRHPSDCL